MGHAARHWPIHLSWIYVVCAFLVPSLKAWETAHPSALVSQAVGVVLILAARYQPLGKAQ